MLTNQKDSIEKINLYKYMKVNQPELPLLHENIVKANIYTVMSHIVNKDGTSFSTTYKCQKITF